MRERIGHLKRREARLRQALIAAPPDRGGSLFELVIRRPLRRAFLRDRLPPEVLDRAELWDIRRSQEIMLRRRNPAAAAQAANAVPAPARHPVPPPPTWRNDDFAVIESF